MGGGCTPAAAGGLVGTCAGWVVMSYFHLLLGVIGPPAGRRSRGFNLHVAPWCQLESTAPWNNLVGCCTRLPSVP